MSKAIVTFGVNEHAGFLDIMLPTYKAFGELHGWDLLILQDIPRARPPAWYKVCALMSALESYDEALFVGADTIVVDGSEDLVIPPGYWQGMVFHHTGDGEVPNTDFWYCRKDMLPVLSQVWDNKKWLTHGWWEQASLMDLMGYQVPAPAHLISTTELYEKTYRIPAEWNVHKWDVPQPAHPRIQHATMYPDRNAILRAWLADAKNGWMVNDGLHITAE